MPKQTHEEEDLEEKIVRMLNFYKVTSLYIATMVTIIFIIFIFERVF